ncbi:cell division trigger factor [Lachnospiraceae bacterium KM106-2]|nr:cell division trigger factor [Lachnospiraceae bacterium KM106-2]
MNGKGNEMKKIKIMTLLLAMSLLAVGCNKKNSSNKSTASASPSPSATASASPYTDKEETKILNTDISGDVTLGEYIGIKVTKDKIEVSDEDVQSQIDSTLKDNATNVEVKDRKTIKKGDIVNIDFVGKKDGKAFDGGSATGYDLTIGSNQFIEGFEDKLIGKKVGTKQKLNLTFPTNYSNTELAGQKVVFEVTINKIQKSETPKLNDAFVKKVSKKSKTVAEYKKEVKASLESEKKTEAESNVKSDVMNKIIKNAKVKTYPKDQVKYYGYIAQTSLEQQLTQSGMTLDSYLEQIGKTQKDFEKEVESVGKSTTKQKMVFQAIAKKENIKVTDAEYKKQLKSLLSAYSLKDEAALIEKYGNAPIADMKQYLLYQKVIDFVVDKAKVTESK